MLLRRLSLFPLAFLFFQPLAWPQSAPTVAAASAPTAVPPLVPYSGIALADDGKALSAEKIVTFLIYKEESGGEPLWAESQTVAVDSTGHYKVQLGAASPNGLPGDLFATGEARWLEAQIAGQAAQSRVLLASVPYALKAGDATTLGGLPASAYALAGAKFAPSSQTASPNANSTVTTPGGTTGYVPLFTGAATIADSQIFDNGTDVGIGTTTPTATLDVVGTAIITGGLNAQGGANVGGSVNILATGNASASAGKTSQPLAFVASSYNSSSKTPVAQIFRLEAEPTGNDTASPSGTLNLLFGSTPVETGLYFNPNGTINFAPGQTFPGTGAGTITGVTAGTGLTGGGTSGVVTLAVDPTKVAELGASNSLRGPRRLPAGT